MKRVLVIIGALSLGACSSAQTGMSRMGANFSNRSADITCYSGGEAIFTGRSKGKVSSEAQSDGYTFLDNDTGKLLEVSGACIIKYD